MRALYDFECGKCGVHYEEFATFDESGIYEEVFCPECGSGEKSKLMTTCAYKFANPVGTDRWNSDSGGHDYRYKFNMPNVKKQREEAEKRSHMGSSPYKNIDDVSSGKYFGEVK